MFRHLGEVLVRTDYLGHAREFHSALLSPKASPGSPAFSGDEALLPFLDAQGPFPDKLVGVQADRAGRVDGEVLDDLTLDGAELPTGIDFCVSLGPFRRELVDPGVELALDGLEVRLFLVDEGAKPGALDA